MIPFQNVQEAATIIKQGGVVAFPTETYYGLAVDPFNETALDKLFRLKKRPENKPLLTLIRGLDQLLTLAESVPPCFLPLIKLWPAPLTLVFPASKALSGRLTAGTHTIGVRISPHPVAMRLVELCGQPITATSANLSGVLAANSAREVAVQFPRGVDYILDGGMTPGGAGSTLVGCVDGRPVLLRSGILAPESLPCTF
ncbi:MAG: threonylcarbamoyl-AMP synthase [Proteobacteria bacterium]|nr:threonylcarbamoyl-AMP synthase [Pseudomonadota bacterium]MBU1641290.1 threonylcarbamoyl-AMP synthase [Pseudomonadota bacterium]